MDKITELLNRLADYGIGHKRWYTIDNLLMFQPFDRPTDKDYERMNKLLVEPDYFQANDLWCVDMNKQNYAEKENRDAIGKVLKQVSRYKEPKAKVIPFTLD